MNILNFFQTNILAKNDSGNKLHLIKAQYLIETMLPSTLGTETEQ